MKVNPLKTMDKTNNQLQFKVSVVIPAYNIERYIVRAIDSVLQQTHPADEIIVIDDGSTDGTAGLIKQYGSQVKYIHQENAGLSAARNTGIKLAQNTWIAFLDGDDEWREDYLEKQLALLQRNRQLVWSGTNYLLCLCDENRQGPNLDPAKIQQRLGTKEYFPDYFTAFLDGPCWCADTVIVKKEVFETTGLFLEGLRRAEDMDMWFRIAFHWEQFGFISEPLAVYHLDRPGCLSKQFTPAKLYCDLIERQMKYAAELGKQERFKPCAAKLLRGWMRSMLFEARGSDIRQIMRQFDRLLPGWYKLFMGFLTIFPRATAAGCHLISRIIRALRLRKQLVRKPE